jgi:glycosyltransferase involved in cell wall biosynthesis
MRISGVVNTRNAAATLAEALQSLAPWVDEIVVVDMHSTDATREIAAREGARVLLHEPVGYVEPARKWSIEQTTGDWIVVLDADEIIPLRLSERLREIASSDEADVVNVPEFNYFFGRPMLHGGWHPDEQRHLRFFKRGAVTPSVEVHAHPHISDGARLLELKYEPGLGIVHFAYSTITQFVDRTHRYTSFDTGEPPRGTLRLMRHAAGEARGRLFNRAGFRDGSRGVVLALLMGIYEGTLWLKRSELHRPEATKSRKMIAGVMNATAVVLKCYEARRWGDPEEIRKEYLAVARSLVSEYRPTRSRALMPEIDVT